VIIRVVRMTFRPDAVDAFRQLFAERCATIRGFTGCTHLELWQEAGDNTVMATCSHWQSAEHLDAYRASPFFADTWAATKALFAAPAQAWSYERVL